MESAGVDRAASCAAWVGSASKKCITSFGSEKVPAGLSPKFVVLIEDTRGVAFLLPQVIKGDKVPDADKGAPSSSASSSSSSSAAAESSDGPGTRSKFAFPSKPAAKPAAKKQPQEAEAAAKKPKGPFEYELVHQSRLDLGNAWKDSRAAADAAQLDRLVVRVKLPEVATVSEITLDTSKTTLLVAAHGKCALVPSPCVGLRHLLGKEETLLPLPVPCFQQSRLRKRLESPPGKLPPPACLSRALAARVARSLPQGAAHPSPQRG